MAKVTRRGVLLRTLPALLLALLLSAFGLGSPAGQAQAGQTQAGQAQAAPSAATANEIHAAVAVPSELSAVHATSAGEFSTVRVAAVPVAHVATQADVVPADLAAAPVTIGAAALTSQFAAGAPGSRAPPA